MVWVDNEEVSKLLRALFGLSITSSDVDTYLYKQIQKKLTYWCTTKNNATDRGTVVNSVLLSAMFYFLPIWGVLNGES